MGNSVQIKDGSFHLVSGSTNISASTTGSEYIASVTIDPNDPTSFYISGSNLSASIYISSSGKMGFGTTDPLVAFDVRADEFQIQKTSKRQGVRVNEEGNIESFNSETDAAATGSEFILSYTRGGTGKVTATNLQSIYGAEEEEIVSAGGAAGYFRTLSPRDQDKILFLLEREGGNIDKASVGDVLGSIRWVAASGSTSTLDSRTAGEAATIQATVNAANKYGTSADLIFKVADQSALEGASSDLGAAAAPKTALLLDGDFQHEITGSLDISDNLSVGGRFLGNNIISSSAQIASNISGSFVAASGSFSTRVTANDAKVSMVIGTAANQAKAGNTTTISTAQANAITANTAKIGLSTGELEGATLTATAMGNADEGYKIRFSLTIEGADAALNGDLTLR